MIICINSEHIKSQTNPNKSDECAIWKALSEVWPDETIHVTLDDIKIGEKIYYVSPSLYTWQVSNVFNTENTMPFKLELCEESNYADLYVGQ